MTDHWCKYCNGMNTHNCQFNTDLPRMKIYTTNTAVVSDNEALLRQALERLRAEVERLRTDGASAVRWAPGSAYWSDVLRDLFGPDARKGIDVLERRWQAELERADKLAEALRELEEREQRDEALLRQALEALLGQRGEPDWHTGKQRENAIAALRERLGEKE